MEKVEVLIIGAGAAGLMCAIEAGKRQRQVLVLDQANKAGKKILMSGGGRCNFTNLSVGPANFISHNPHFCKSALSRYTQWDFIERVRHYKITYHEKTLGQLFCDHKSKAILDMLITECELANARIRLNVKIENVEKIADHHFKVNTNQGIYHCQSLVIATGGLSIPSMGASPFGYKIAEQFGLKIWPTRAGLVPFTLQERERQKFEVLAGIAIDSLVTCKDQSFRENILFTHRGLSGPAILQISSYWHTGEEIVINMLPEINWIEYLKSAQKIRAQQNLKTILTDLLPKRVIEVFLEDSTTLRQIASFSYRELAMIAQCFNNWRVKPHGTEGYRTAEVTLGGVDCNAISSKTMETIDIPGLYFIGEVVDVTGWLGGYNFQWAWSSGWSSGQVV